MANQFLGSTFKDVVTGFTGVCIGYVEYITGCNQMLLQPQVSESGDFKDSQWMDAQRCALIDGPGRLVLNNGTTPGCDKPAPKR